MTLLLVRHSMVALFWFLKHLWNAIFTKLYWLVLEEFISVMNFAAFRQKVLQSSLQNSPSALIQALIMVLHRLSDQRD